VLVRVCWCVCVGACVLVRVCWCVCVGACVLVRVIPSPSLVSLLVRVCKGV